MLSSDPITVSFQDGNLPTPSYSGAHDTKIRGDRPDQIFGSSGTLEIDGNPDMASLLRWDVSQIPAGSTVLAASLTVNVVKTSQDFFNIYGVLQPWLESETTFNEVRAGVPWDTAGAQGAGDRGTTVLGTLTGPETGTVTVELGSAGIALAQSWVANPSVNHGIVIQNYDDGSTDDLDLRAREGDGFSPLLTLTYSEGELPPNDPPLADDQAVATDEDTVLPVTLTGSDPDGDPISFVVVENPASGVLGGVAPNLTYTPHPDFYGSDSFGFKANDGFADSPLATVSITVNPINDRPVANDLTVSTTLDNAASFTLNGFDVDGDALSYSLLSAPVHGSLTGTAPTLTYTPSVGYVGSDSFTYSVSDGLLESTAGLVSISVLSEPVAADGVWLDTSELMALPTSGPAWDALVEAADTTANSPDISDQGDNTDVYTLAKALVGVRLGDASYIAEARSNIMAAIGTEDGGRTLALGRNLAPYVIAADLVGLDSQDDSLFRDWLRETLTEELTGRTLQSTHEDRPNNWGTMSGASRAAVAVYLGDQEELERTATVFKGYLGDRDSYADFSYGELSWQADPDNPVGINPVGATKDGHNIDGVMPDDMRRGGSFAWPPAETGYPWEGLQGAFVQAEILYRAGYATYQWEDQALLRAVQFLNGIGWEAEGDDQWQTWLIDARYGTDYAINPTAGHGKIMGWTSWTHQGGAEPTIQASGDAYTVSEDQTLQVSAPGVLENDVHPDGDPLSAVLMNGPDDGTLTLEADGSFSYTATADFNGSDAFQYRATDGSSNSNVVTVSITVTPANDAPVALGQSVSTRENEPVAITLTGSDVDGDTLTYSVLGGPANGSLSGTAPDLTYTPGADYNGTDSFTFAVSDGTSQSDAATVTISVAANNSPTADSQSVTTAEDTPLTITLTASDPDGDPLDYTLVSLPARGTLSGTAPQLTYTPNSDFFGSDSFAFKANDGLVDSSPATVSIAVQPVNDAPVAADDTYSVMQNTVLTVPVVGVLANDSDVEGDALTVQLVSGPSHGTLTLGTFGSFDYTPQVSFVGTDSFVYQASDGEASSNSATVTIIVESPPVYVATGENTVSGDVVANDYTDTAAADGVVETIREERTNGNPATRLSFLDHRWTFAGVDSAVSFYLTASRPNNPDGDDFAFQYSTDGGGNWTHLVTVDTPDLTLFPVTLPATVSGTVHVRVVDTIPNTAGNKDRDSVDVDQLYFSGEPVAPLVAEFGAATRSTSSKLLTPKDLEAAAGQAIDYWQQRDPGSPNAWIASSVDFQIVQLGGSYLGLAHPGQNRIQIDVDAAGWGWNRVDLLATLTHEIGHLYGYGHETLGESLVTMAHAGSWSATLPRTGEVLPQVRAGLVRARAHAATEQAWDLGRFSWSAWPHPPARVGQIDPQEIRSTRVIANPPDLQSVEEFFQAFPDAQAGDVLLDL